MSELPLETGDNDERRRTAISLQMQDYRQSWRRGIHTKSLLVLEQEREWWEDMIVADPRRAAEDFKILEELDGRIEVLRDKIIRQGERENPLAFCVPTYEQAQFLNSWSPEFDPVNAPEGYNSVCNFGGKRSGKTLGTILHAILWMVPNDPEWSIFREHEDPYGRGKYRVFRRPMFDIWHRQGRMVYSHDEAPMQAQTIWHGCVDEQHWKAKIDRQYRRWMPMRYVKKVDGGKSYCWNISERYFETEWGTRVVGMLYKSDIQAWGGDELGMVIFDEGPPRAVVEEVVARSLYVAWSYTPAEAANTSDRVQVAREVYDGTLLLVGKTHILKSDMRKMREDIIPAKVLDRRIATLSTMGEHGRIAMEGGFYDSSPRVFDLFVRERHVLPITGEMVRRWIHGKWTPEERTRFPWCGKFEDANVIRGFDEGFVHDTACVWAALLRSGEQVFFREFAKSATSLKERVERIVEMSGHTLKEVRKQYSPAEERENQIAAMYGHELAADREREKATGETIRRFREEQVGEFTRKTFGDSKLFKRDPKFLKDTWGDNYARAGLKLVRASTLLPEQRCSYMNGLFRANPSRQHLNPAQATDENPNGYDLYVTSDCTMLIERLERYLWETFTAGPRKGDASGKPGVKDDDLPDAAGYAVNHKLRWIPNAELKDRRNID